MSLETVTKYVLHEATFLINEYKGGDPIYFDNETEANKIASLKRGWYNSTGSVYKKEFGAILPKHYATAEDWAKDNLTYNEFLKHFN